MCERSLSARGHNGILYVNYLHACMQDTFARTQLKGKARSVEYLVYNTRARVDIIFSMQ